jgi:T5orf172 domain
MNSEVFFKDEQAKWKGKKGLYVIECPLFSTPCAGTDNKRKVYKVGYAYQSLAVRIGDYRTHYGKIPFTIHLIWEVPNPPGYRVNFALQTEQRIHKTLHDLKKSTGVKTKEWFYDLPVINDVILSLRNEYMNGTKGANNTYKPIPACETTWLFYIGNKDCTGEKIEPTTKHEVRWSTSKSIFDDVYALDDDEKEAKFRSTTFTKKEGKK